MKLFFFFLFISMFCACNNSSNIANPQSDTAKADKEANPAPGLTGCYRKVLQRDTILLQLQQSGDSVSGTMHFDNYQKDSSKGAVKGRINNDTVVLWYDFFSEGMHSVMEIVLKKTEDGLVRAVGPIETRGDTALFKSHSELKFDPQQTLHKIECDR